VLLLLGLCGAQWLAMRQHYRSNHVS